MSHKTDTEQLHPYTEAGWQLIPLHRWDYVDGKGRQRGKSPADLDWTKRPYNSRDQIKHMEGGSNVGVRLRACDLVIDVDPRNFPDTETLETENPFSRLCEDCGIDPAQYPTVVTGSGGLHLYCTKPEDVSIRDSHESYPGVEFKTLGRQVVAAGSLHPDTKNMYEWDFLTPELGEVPPAPERLIHQIRRPQAASGGSVGGEYDQLEVARMLDALDPEDFRDQQAWLELMMACHHASGGDARAEFIEWSTRDPEYSTHSQQIATRWDSLSAQRPGEASITHRTLLKALTDRDLHDVIPRKGAEDDFEDDDDFGAIDQAHLPEHERKGPLEQLNDTPHICVVEGGKFKVMTYKFDPEMERHYWERMSAHDFKLMYGNRRMQRGNGTVELGEAWLKWAGRKQANGVVFDPERDHPGYLNLWRGWAVTPKRGGWEYLNELLFEVLCDGDERIHAYVLDWAAHMVQKPGSPAEVAICFQGQKGVGKGTFLRALLWLCGTHGMQIASSSHLTGNFNAHLRDLIFLFADEAVNPYDKQSESRLKALITEPTLAIEAKGVDVKTVKNRLHIGMASNEDWFVPMGLDGERRFLLQMANNKRQGDTNFFDRVHGQMKNDGLQALLFDLLRRDIGRWSPRNCIPATQASTEQKLRGMSPIGQWWFERLSSGDFDVPFYGTGAGDEQPDWETENVRLFKQDVKESFERYCRSAGIRMGGSSRSVEIFFAKELKKLLPDLKPKVQHRVPDDRKEFDIKTFSDGRAWAYEMPSLIECRMQFNRVLNFEYDWAVDEEDDDAWLT